jgi:hypothetical protein
MWRAAATPPHKGVDPEQDEHKRREFMHAMRVDPGGHMAAPMHDAMSNSMNASAFSCGVSRVPPVQLVG